MTAEPDFTPAGHRNWAHPQWMVNRTAYLASIRRDIEMHLAIVAELSAKGLEPREYIRIRSDDEFRMDRSFYSLGAWCRRYGEVLTEMYARVSREVAREAGREIGRAAA